MNVQSTRLFSDRIRILILAFQLISIIAIIKIIWN